MTAVAKTPVKKLVFVYNANSGVLDAMIDSARKVLRINGCALCEVTHGLVGEKSEWRSCERALGVEIDYLHKDEIPGDLAGAIGETLPVVVAVPETGEPVRLLEASTIERCRGSVQDLRGKLLFWAARNDLSL